MVKFSILSKSFVFLVLCLVFSSANYASEQKQAPSRQAQEQAQQDSGGVRPFHILKAQREKLEQLRHQQSTFESENNAYDIGLAEISLNIAEIESELGEYKKAMSSFRRYLHIMRVNEGLQSTKQIAVLEKMIETAYKFGYRQQAGKIATELDSKLTTSIISRLKLTTKELAAKGEWHLRQFKHSLPEHQETHLNLAYKLFKSAAEVQVTEDKQYSPSMHIMMCSIDNKIAQMNRRGLLLTDSLESRAAYERCGETLKHALFYAQHLEQPEYSIHVKMLLGDWEKQFRMFREARDFYVSAYKQTQTLNENHPMAKLFEHPQPSFRFDAVDKIVNDKPDTIHTVTVSKTITQFGNVSNTKLVDASFESQWLEKADVIRAAIQKSNALKYRPRIIDGNLIRTKNVIKTINIPVYVVNQLAAG